VIRREGARLVVSGTATLATIDLGEVKELDSSLLAALLGWRRLVRAQGGELRVENMPPALATIARLYGVDELLPAAA
jgi:phospholipid transport system transporter-binding protein